MQNKLQELTDKLYNEGLSKGKKEAEELLAKAEKQAADILADAKKQAEKIISDAKKESEEMENKTRSDLKMASSQIIATLKQQIENAIVSKVTSDNIKAAVSDIELMKNLITTIAKAFNPDSSKAVPLCVILSEEMKSDLDNFLKNELSKNLNTGIEVKYDRLKSGGFKIGPKDGSYIISFTDKDFEALVAEYLRPKTRELLF